MLRPGPNGPVKRSHIPKLDTDAYEYRINNPKYQQSVLSPYHYKKGPLAVELH